MTEVKDKIEEKISPAVAVDDSQDSAVKTDTVATPEGEVKKKIKKAKRQILKGRATVKCTYNNTIVAIADINGAILGWASSGMLGFKGAKKATPYAASQVVASVSEKVKKYGLRELEVFVKGVGSGREASVRALANNGFELLMIKDITPIPHNGCRPKKPRRV